MTAVLVTASGVSVRVASAQEQTPVADRLPTGVWIGASSELGGALLDRRSALPWKNVGRFGLSFGGAGSLGYDFRRLGGAIGVDVLRVRVGGRAGSSLAVAAVARWSPDWEPILGWPSRLVAGYVRYGLGGAPVAPAELPATVFRAGNAGLAGGDARLTLLGNGARLGLSAERALDGHRHIVVELGGDVMYFDTVAYQGYDLSLAEAGWGFIPRLAVGVRVSPRF